VPSRALRARGVGIALIVACTWAPTLAGARVLAPPAPLPGGLPPLPKVVAPLPGGLPALPKVVSPLPGGLPALPKGLPSLPRGLPPLPGGLPALPQAPPLPNVPVLPKVPPLHKVLPAPAAGRGPPRPAAAGPSRVFTPGSRAAPGSLSGAPSSSMGISRAARSHFAPAGGRARTGRAVGVQRVAAGSSGVRATSTRRSPGQAAGRAALGGHSPSAARTGSTLPPGPPSKAQDPLSTIGRALPLALPVPDWSKPIILLLLLLAGGLGLRSRLATRRARRLQAVGTALTQDLDSAQAALVPVVAARVGDLSVSVAYSPADGPAAGGDFYDAFGVRGAGVAVILGDASGHGRDALARSALMRYTLRAYVEAGLAPRAALALAGQVLAGETGEEFTTVAVALYEGATGTLTYAVAGHPPPIVLGETDHMPVTACSSPPVGWDQPTGRRQTSLTLPAGARACFFSDGLTESRTDGTMLGRTGLTEILHQLGPDASAAALLERVRDVADEASDDMAACIIGPDPARGAREARVEELELDAGQMGGTQAERFLAACQVPAEEVPEAVMLARRTAAESGAAVLRVQMQPLPAQVTVVAREEARGRAAPLAARLSSGASPAVVPA